MSLTNFRRYRNINASSDFKKYRGTLIQQVRPVILTGKATVDLEPGRIVIASDATQPNNDYIASDLGYAANWAYPTAGVTANKLLGVVLKQAQEQWAKPVAMTDYATDNNEGDIVKAGEIFRVLVQGMVFATTKATTIGIESTIFVKHATDFGIIEVATDASNTNISSSARCLAYKSKASANANDFHCVPLYVDFLSRI